MRTKPSKEAPREKRKRVVFYLDPQVFRRLKHEKAETDKDMSLIVEEALKTRLGRRAVASTSARSGYDHPTR